MRRHFAIRPARALLLTALVTAAPALAQGSSALFGQVTDAATHKPVADVVVTARSKALPAEQVMVTDESGTYRISQLPPGDYSLHFERPGYQPSARQALPLRLEQSLHLNVELLPEVARNIEIHLVGKPTPGDVSHPFPRDTSARMTCTPCRLSPPPGVVPKSARFIRQD